jgi:drug/metabolite transporter (DMT)-like permease
MEKKLKKYRRYYGVTVILAFITVIISFSPLTIPHGKYQPELAGLPYSLWMGIITTVVLVALTYIATRVHPGSMKEKLTRKEPRDD